jgi:hypothetical protein
MKGAGHLAQGFGEPGTIRIHPEITQSMRSGSADRQDTLDRQAETLQITKHYRNVSAWFLSQASATPVGDHLDRLFVDDVLLKRAQAHAAHSETLKQSLQSGMGLAQSDLLHEYRRLAALFRVELTSFNRKQYVNLSHERNKAMNLSSYMGLIGKSFRLTQEHDGIALQETHAPAADFTVPDAKYVVSLDADSLLMPGYLLHMIHHMEQPENQRVAVAQSPYMAVPGAPGVLERTAAATVAPQYVVHMGFTRYDAAFWVGANAVIRKAALAEIRVSIQERGYTMSKYISDRTHIEDTESTIDLIARGWTLYNSPVQFAYSAPPSPCTRHGPARRPLSNGHPRPKAERLSPSSTLPRNMDSCSSASSSASWPSHTERRDMPCGLLPMHSCSSTSSQSS